VTARALEDEKLGVIVSRAKINNLKFGDDIALVAESRDDLQLLITKTDTESQRF